MIPTPPRWLRGTRPTAQTGTHRNCPSCKRLLRTSQFDGLIVCRSCYRTQVMIRAQREAAALPRS